MLYIQTVLCAFANPPLFDVHNEIQALRSQDNVIAFCSQHTLTYFIIDQMNALDCEDANMDKEDNEQKAVIQMFLNCLTYGQY